jgi:hypothetical protein
MANAFGCKSYHLGISEAGACVIYCLGAPSVFCISNKAERGNGKKTRGTPSPKTAAGSTHSGARRADKFLFAARERKPFLRGARARPPLPCVLFVLIEFPVVSLVS